MLLTYYHQNYHCHHCWTNQKTTVVLVCLYVLLILKKKYMKISVLLRKEKLLG